MLLETRSLSLVIVAVDVEVDQEVIQSREERHERLPQGFHNLGRRKFSIFGSWEVEGGAGRVGLGGL